jgi:multidrug resistance efflux pump
MRTTQATTAPTAASPTPEQALAQMLAGLTQAMPAEGACVLRRGEDGAFEVVAVHPVPADGFALPAWLSVAVRLAGVACGSELRTTAEAIEAGGFGTGLMYDPAGPKHVLVAPAIARGGQALAGLAVVARGSGAQLEGLKLRLELMRGSLEALELAGALRGRERDIDRFAVVVDSAGVLGEHEGFHACAFALCNDLASRFGCERVSVGFLRGNSVRCAAMSHTEKLGKQTPLVHDLELAMEECADQDCEVGVPEAMLEHAGVVHRAATAFVQRHAGGGGANGGGVMLSVPLRVRGRVRGVLTLERGLAAGVFSPAQIESLRLIADLASPRLVLLHDTDRYFGAGLVTDTRRVLAKLLGPTHTWLKVGALAGLAAIVTLFVVPGTYRVDGQFQTQAIVRRAVPAPFDGFLRSALVQVNDKVEVGKTVLGELDDSELRLERIAEEAKRAGAEKRAAKARQDRNEGEAQVADAEVRESQARIDLLADRIGQARLVAPVDGVVVVGDLAKVIGTPVQTGDVLFEVAQLESLRAEIDVPEDQIADVRVGQRGKLATQSFPGQRLAFTVERVEPVARLVGERNVFKVRVVLDERPEWMRPGMEGVARIDAGRKPLAIIWTRRLVNWVRMTLWI